MPIMVRPADGLKPPSDLTKSNAEHVTKLFAWREAQLDEFWLRLAAELGLADAQLPINEGSVRKLAGIGMLMIHDSIVTYDRLQKIQWVKAWQDKPLPRPASGKGLLRSVEAAHLYMSNC